MHLPRSSVLAVGLILAASALALAGCEKKPAPSSPSGPAAGSSAKHDDHDHDHDHDHKPGDGHDHDHDGHDHDHGPVTQLGEQTAGGYTVKALRAGDVKPGSDATFDVAVSGGATKPTAVRLWVGAQDGKGSMKARGEFEKDGWHAHVEVPDPLPAGAKLWVEIEAEGGAKVVAGFDLKT